MTKPTLHIILETGSISGGVAVIGELANRLTARGWTVKIWSIHQRQTMQRWFPLDQRVEWVSFYREGSTADYDQLAIVLKKQAGYKMATYWATAWAAQYAAAPGEGLYLVQDVEVVYAAGPLAQEQVLRTYELGLRHLTTSKWVQRQTDVIGACDYIGIGLDPFYKPLEHTTVLAPGRKPGDKPETHEIKVTRGTTPLALARVTALKGYRQLCEVARYLAGAGFPMALFGQDQKLMMFARHTHRQSPSNKIVRDLYNGAAVYLSTSLHEGFSLPPLEAMACGCPVVMTDADGNMEYAEDGRNCLIGGSPRELADLALQVIHDKALAARLSKSGLETAGRYNWASAVGRVEDLLAA